jgi:beta-lactam-binding protein with PASTA domain
MRMSKRFGLVVTVLAATVLGLTAACAKNEGPQIAPDVVGSTLIEAEGILVAWCENVRVVVDGDVTLDALDPAQVTVAREFADSADPDAPPPPGTLRPGWALEPPPSSTSSTEAATVEPTTAEPTTVEPTPVVTVDLPPPTSPPSANGLVHRLGQAQATDAEAPEPAAVDFCRTGRVPTVHLRIAAEVPDLRGVPVSDAIALLAERGITVDAPAGYHPAAVIEDQSLSAGTVVNLGGSQETSTVAVTPGAVPAELKLVAVPDVEHVGVNVGCALLRSEGFECSVLTASGEVEYEQDWEIVSQWPRVPARAAEGATVKVVVTGPQFAVVPGVIEMPYGTACEILRDEHLICRVSGELGKREVSAQSPEPGISVTPGSVVTLEFTQVAWYETWNGRLILLFVGGIVTGLGGLLVKLAFGGRRRRGTPGPVRR